MQLGAALNGLNRNLGSSASLIKHALFCDINEVEFYIKKGVVIISICFERHRRCGRQFQMQLGMYLVLLYIAELGFESVALSLCSWRYFDIPACNIQV